LFFNHGDDWLQELNIESQALIRQKMTIVKLKEGEALYQQGETAAALYQVVGGLIHIKRITANGGESIVTLCHSGNCFGEIPLLTPEQSLRGYNAIAVGDTEVACLSKQDFEAIAYEHPQVYQQLIVKLCRIIQYLLQHAEDMSNNNLRQRLANLIINAAACHGTEQQGEISIGIPLTQTDMSKMLGVSRQSVQREIKIWREQGWLIKKNGRLIIRDLKQIKHQRQQ